MLNLISGIKNLLKPEIIRNAGRSYRTSNIRRMPRTYDGEGKTTLNILNNESDIGLMINGFSQVGFRLNNDLTILGPMAIFPRSVLSWNVSNDISEVTEEAFSLFVTLEPKLDLIVVGTGDRVTDLSFYKKLLPFLRQHKIGLEILPTEQACATFNFLNSEGRYVAGAMIPPRTVSADDEDIFRTKMRYQELYKTEW